MAEEKKQLYYPNGMPVPVREVWDVIDQLGMTLQKSYQHKKEAKEKEWKGSFGLSDAQKEEAISHRDRLLNFLISTHGDKMVPQAKYTVVKKETNDKGRHYRKGEYRLFIGEYSTFVLEMGITPDELDIDPKKLVAAFTLLEDDLIREAKTPEDRKAILKKLATENEGRVAEWT